MNDHEAGCVEAAAAPLRAALANVPRAIAGERLETLWVAIVLASLTLTAGGASRAFAQATTGAGGATAPSNQTSPAKKGSSSSKEPAAKPKRAGDASTAERAEAQAGGAAEESGAAGDPPVAAPPKPDGEKSVSDQDRQAAAALHEAGQAKMRQGDFKGAEQAFEEAYLRAPNPLLMLAIADAREGRGDGPGAVEALERYLRERADAPDAELIKERIAALRSRPAKLKVATSPPGAAVYVDGKDLGKVTPVELELAPGAHTLELRMEGYETAKEELGLKFGSRSSLTRRLTLDAAGPAFGDGEALSEAKASKKDAAVDPRVPSPAVWVASSVAVAATITGTVLGFLALSDEAAFNAMPTTKLANRGERFALFADVSFGLAIAAASTAIVLYLTQNEDAASSESEVETQKGAAPSKDEPPVEKPAPKEEASLRVVPVVHPALFGMLLEGRL